MGIDKQSSLLRVTCSLETAANVGTSHGQLQTPSLSNCNNKMELSQANLDALNSLYDSRPPSAQRLSPTQIKDVKAKIFATLGALKRFGAMGRRILDAAAVHVINGEVQVRGHEVVDCSTPESWIHQLDVLESMYLPLERLVKGSPEPVMIDEEAQAEQDAFDAYNSSLEVKMQYFLPVCKYPRYLSWAQ